MVNVSEVKTQGLFSSGPTLALVSYCSFVYPSVPMSNRGLSLTLHTSLINPSSIVYDILYQTLRAGIYELSHPFVFNMGHPFCFMDSGVVSERLHNLQPMRHSLCMHITKQILYCLYRILLRSDI